MTEEFTQLKQFIEQHTADMVQLETLLTSYPALAPENGGDGEKKKCDALEAWLKENGISRIEHFDAPDSRVSDGLRPNMIATIPGNKDDYNIWVCAHLDVVPVGELSLWNSDPWRVVEKDGKIFGRGVEDNQQGLVSGVLAALSFVKQHIIPEHTIKLLFMADEEVGSAYGMNFLLREHRELFAKEDLILIPDGGDEKGETIEIAEKNIAWFRFHTIGKQCHGSRPDLGKNAKLAAAELALKAQQTKLKSVSKWEGRGDTAEEAEENLNYFGSKTSEKGRTEYEYDTRGNLIREKKYDIDHFVPWSFVMNDELWNLMPMDSSLNSSKSNRLPKWDPFFRRFADNQYVMYELIQEYPGIHKLYEGCFRDNLHSIWAGQELYRPGNTRETFESILEKNMLPVYDSARRQGYEIWYL